MMDVLKFSQMLNEALMVNEVDWVNNDSEYCEVFQILCNKVSLVSEGCHDEYLLIEGKLY